MSIQKRKTSANWYARFQVPQDLQTIMGKSDIWKSLKTPIKKEASIEAEAVFASWLAKCDKARGRPATEADLRQAGNDHYEAEKNDAGLGRFLAPKRAEHDAMKFKIAEEIRGGATPNIVHHCDLALSDPSAHVDLQSTMRGHRRKVLVQHLREGETILVEWAADNAIASQGLDIVKGTPPYFDLCQRLQRAELEALNRADEHDQGIFGREPSDPVVKPPSASQKALLAEPGESIMELFELFYRERAGAI